MSSPYIAITADAHAGASVDAYREYLDPALRAAFDDWRGSYSNPAKKHVGGKKTKNWDSAERQRDLEADGVVAEVIFPNTVPPFYDTAFHIAPPPTAAHSESSHRPPWYHDAFRGGSPAAVLCGILCGRSDEETRRTIA